LYVPTALGAVAGVAMFWKLIIASPSAGFSLKDFTWYQYFFTQCRALFVYLRIFVLPVSLNADWEYPVSRTLFDRGAIVGLVVLIAISAAAWHYRRRFPLASYGWFMFLLLMAPTSSIVPIRDTIAERRLYLSMPGLLLIGLEFLRRWKVDRQVLAAACAVVVLFATAATNARAAVWSNALDLWQDTIQKSPGKSRPHFQLGMSYFDAGRYDLAIAEYERTAQIDPPTHGLLIDWALALDKLDKMQPALDKLHQAAEINRTAHVYTQIAVVYAKRGMWKEAEEALDTAERIDNRYAPVYLYRGNIYMKQTPPDVCAAIGQYKHALFLDSINAEAQQNLQIAELESRGACH
jgi:tetratricopeptide (TPR) repeat protein